MITVVATVTPVVGYNATNTAQAGSGSVSYPTSCIIRLPAGSVTVYFGGIGVTTANGQAYNAGESLEVDLVNEILYAIVASGTQTISILRRGD